MEAQRRDIGLTQDNDHGEEAKENAENTGLLS
jgi:hypothetical protein